MTALAKTVSGVRWGTISTVINTFFQLFFMALMARLLEPADFGLIAIANVSLRFYSYFSQVGIAPALIQKKSLEKGDVNAALTLSLSISSAFLLLAYFSSPLTEFYFDIYGLSAVMQVLAFNFIIFGFSSISQALLLRDSRFKVIAKIEIVSYILGYGVTGLASAYMGLGVWALVAAFMTQSILASILFYLAILYPISFKHAKAQRKHLMGFGVRYSVIGFIEFLTSNIVPLIIGKFLGAVPAGYFNRALLLADLPVQQPANILTKTLFPIMSKVSDQHYKQLISFQLSVLLVGCYACAVSIGIHNAAYDLVTIMLGSKWLEAIPILEILTLSVAPTFIAHVAGVALDTMAELKLKLRIQLTVFLLMVMQLLWLRDNLTIEVISYIVLSTSFIRLFLMCGSIIHLLKISLKEVMLILATFISVTLITYICTLQIPILFGFVELPVIRLIIDIVAGGLGLVISLFFVRYLVKQLQSIEYLQQKLPMFRKIMEF